MLKRGDAVPEGQNYVLSSLPPSPAQKRLALGIVLALCVALALVTGPFGGMQLGAIHSFVAVYTTAMFVIDLITAIILFAQFSILRSRAILVIASGYLFTALLIVPYVLAFPGVLAPNGLVGGLQTSAHLYLLWHCGFPLFVIGYALSKDAGASSDVPTEKVRPAIVRSILWTVTGAMAAALLSIDGGPGLPRIMLDQSTFVPNWPYVVGAPIALLCMVALAVLWVRRQSILDLVLMVVLCTYLIEIPPHFYPAPARFSTGWYAVRVTSLMSSSIVLIVLLYEISALYARLLSVVLGQRRIVELSRMLASETAASQENARLYRELQEREGRVRRLFNSNIIGIFTWNLDGHIISANDAFGRIVGYGSDDMMPGKLSWKDLMPPEWDPGDDQVMTNMLATGVAPPFEAEYVRKDGVRVPVLIGAALFDGTPTEGVAFVLDLTDRKRAEQAARESDQRYHDIERQLADANRIASIAQLSATIAHEINQPLSGIITNASTGLRMLAADPPDIEGARETARRAIRDGNRAADVITRLRALFSRQEIMLKPISLNEATREVVTMAWSDFEKNGVTLQLELGQDLPAVSGDRIQLQQVILNLLRNGSEAMAGVHDRPRRLVISTERDNDNHVRFAVRDVGVGLDLEGSEKLFAAFYSTKPGGMGIGLSISRSIIEEHHGRLWAEPNDDQGATFSFSIPRHTES
ncbi:MASE4 domain-containing protein [Variovorax sp. RT4R15]|uniref:MASE4 domain-containing protein n=1 Tax=Variovorax sp. RT4R15 TaxID=3443737 RepID=UPI003F45FC5B